MDSSLTTDLDCKDTWHVALGTQYRVSDPWLLSAGIAYDSSMLDDGQRSPALPVGASWRFGLGAEYLLNRNLTLGGAYELVWGGDLSMDVNRGLAGRVSGEYTGSALHVIALNLGWKL
jgi:long-chain fatty acid transport protein